MKHRVCKCGYVFPFVIMRGAGISFTQGAVGSFAQICPTCGKERDIIVLRPMETERVVVRQ